MATAGIGVRLGGSNIDGTEAKHLWYSVCDRSPRLCASQHNMLTRHGDKMLRTPLFCLAVSLAAGTITQSCSFGASFVWDNGGTGNNWSTTNNWDPRGIPLTDDSARFADGDWSEVDINNSVPGSDFSSINVYPNSTSNIAKVIIDFEGNEASAFSVGVGFAGGKQGHLRMRRGGFDAVWTTLRSGSEFYLYSDFAYETNILEIHDDSIMWANNGLEYLNRITIYDDGVLEARGTLRSLSSNSRIYNHGHIKAMDGSTLTVQTGNNSSFDWDGGNHVESALTVGLGSTMNVGKTTSNAYYGTITVNSGGTFHKTGNAYEVAWGELLTESYDKIVLNGGASTATLSGVPVTIHDSVELRVTSGLGIIDAVTTFDGMYGGLVVHDNATADLAAASFAHGGLVSLGSASELIVDSVVAIGGPATDSHFDMDGSGNNATVRVASSGRLDVTAGNVSNDTYYNGQLFLAGTTSLRLDEDYFMIGGSGFVSLENGLLDSSANIGVSNDGTIRGTGTVAGKLINSDGRIEPRAAGGAGYGVINVTEDALLFSPSILSVTLGGGAPSQRGADRLSTIERTYIDSDLEILVDDVSLLQPGDRFTVLSSADEVEGQFNAISQPNLSGGLGMELAYNLQSVEVVVTGIRGDYNYDGVVDAADYTVWRDELGSTASTLSADGDLDGDVDGDDYALWRLNYGQTSASPLTVAVPEPGSAAFLLAGLVLVARRHCRS